MSKKIEMRKCVICGKKFTPKTANASVCGDKCRKALKAKHDKARKAKKAKKPVKVEGKAVEKIALPKKDVKKPIKKIAPKKPVKKVEKRPEAAIRICGDNPFKIAVLAFIGFLKAIGECNTKVHAF
jgi:predicted nucleic acid-binding Zn ribbon protein